MIQTVKSLPVAHLYIHVNSNFPELLEMYKSHIEKHNQEMRENPFPNSGFDLLVPTDQTFTSLKFQSQFMDFQIKTEMKFNDQPAAFYLYPRSSLSKTPLMLSNHVGIIDSSYRGNIKAAFRSFVGATEDFVAEKHTRLVQICHPSLCPIIVTLVAQESDLSETTRGTGGFGSTGK